MKRHTNIILAMAFAAMMIGCEDSGILNTTDPLLEDSNPNSQHELLGNWYQLDSNGAKNTEFLLSFSDGYLTVIKISDQCNKFPELQRVYTWEENKQSGYLSLTTKRHVQCGVVLNPGQRVEIPFKMEENTLTIFENIFVKEK